MRCPAASSRSFSSQKRCRSSRSRPELIDQIDDIPVALDHGAFRAVLAVSTDVRVGDDGELERRNAHPASGFSSGYNATRPPWRAIIAMGLTQTSCPDRSSASEDRETISGPVTATTLE